MSALSGETYRLAFPTIPNAENPAYISYGRPFDEACAHHVTNTLHAHRAYIVASTSLSKNTDKVEKLKAALGDRCVGVRVGIAPHTPWNEVIDTSNEAKAKDADCIITIGGGSLVDGAKAMLLFMANDITTVAQVFEFQGRIAATREAMNKRSSAIDCIAPTASLVCIPTTLSGGEYTSYAGGTDPATGMKSILGHPFCGPRLIINDPQLTTTAPEWVWLSTGVRAIDHCVEAYCRLVPEDEEVDDAALLGLRRLVPNLLKTKAHWLDENARLDCMLGVNAATIMLKKGVIPGASHGIGHQLGPLGVGHGQTSCILLPSVMKWNAKANSHKQQRLKQMLWSEPPVEEVLKRRGLDVDNSDAGDALDAVFRELGMPRSLTEVGVSRDKFQGLAVNSLKDPCALANPIPLTTTDQVMEILEMCA